MDYNGFEHTEEQKISRNPKNKNERASERRKGEGTFLS